ncbi:glycosyltransferase family 2 protein [Sphingomonas sp. SAFR-052]|uniref:glycosyltransferase family 2 protein n=1 Tax=Sphingomonas sp. SAFR-052 TaxID=3436867 RepID=UPI003F7E1110
MLEPHSGPAETLQRLGRRRSEPEMSRPDTYFYLLDRPEQRQFGLLGYDIRHVTERFDAGIYARARGLSFGSADEAYADWVAAGRRLGLAYNATGNTTLKIILKVKDEPELIDKWVNHHAAIVGYENIVILDCGSQDPEYLAKIARHARKMIVLSYPNHYNTIHNPHANIDLYNLICANARYVTILDADEFLFAADDGVLSADAVVPLLQCSDEAVFAGTWLNAQTVIPEVDGALDWSVETELAIGPRDLAQGTVAGKAVIATSVVQRLSHLGHNLHVPEVAGQMGQESFGKIFIIHARNLDPRIVEKRAIKHLRTKGVLPEQLVDRGEIRDFLEQYRHDTVTLASDAKIYVTSILNRFTPPAAQAVEQTSLLAGAGSEVLPLLNANLRQVDFAALVAACTSKAS